MKAYQQAWQAKVAGVTVRMMEEGLLDMALRDDEIVYLNVKTPDSPPPNWTN